LHCATTGPNVIVVVIVVVVIVDARVVIVVIGAAVVADVEGAVDPTALPRQYAPSPTGVAHAPSTAPYLPQYDCTAAQHALLAYVAFPSKQSGFPHGDDPAPPPNVHVPVELSWHPK
jgi:hypothetical protein